MSNDSLFLRCRYCGETQFVADFWPDGLALPAKREDRVALGELTLAFLDRHISDCRGPADGLAPADGPIGIDLVDEITALRSRPLLARAWAMAVRCDQETAYRKRLAAERLASFGGSARP